MFSFTAYKLNADSTLSHKEHLNHDELDQWMASKYGKFATIKVVRDQDSKSVTYTDDGEKWVRV